MNGTENRRGDRPVALPCQSLGHPQGETRLTQEEAQE
jgi:hypothetical protein